MGDIGNLMLLLVCDVELGFALRNDCPRSFDFRGQHFEDLDDRDFNGFYDFLRDDSLQVLGISFSPSAPTPLIDIVENLPYVEIPNLSTARIFFGMKHDFDPSTSCDQYFGDNRIYHSESGRIAISFSLAPLKLQEIKSIPTAGGTLDSKPPTDK